MKRTIGLLALLLLACKMLMAQTLPTGDPTSPGIVLVAQNLKTNSYEIKLTAVRDASQAQLLDSKMLAKYGIVSCVTEWTTKICRVEATRKVTEDHLRQVVEMAGLKVAKTFNE
jgi:hypothetical protein